MPYKEWEALVKVRFVLPESATVDAAQQQAQRIAVNIAIDRAVFQVRQQGYPQVIRTLGERDSLKPYVLEVPDVN